MFKPQRYECRGQRPHGVHRSSTDRPGEQCFQPVVNGVAFAARSEDAEVGEALELIRDGLRFQAERRREFGNAEFISPHQGVQQPETGIVAEDFVHGREAASLNRRE